MKNLCITRSIHVSYMSGIEVSTYKHTQHTSELSRLNGCGWIEWSLRICCISVCICIYFLSIQSHLVIRLYIKVESISRRKSPLAWYITPYMHIQLTTYVLCTVLWFRILVYRYIFIGFQLNCKLNTKTPV